MECPICLDNKVNIQVYPCTHKFCRCCAKQWVNTHFTCPLCRQLCELPMEDRYYYGSDPHLFTMMKLIGVY
jgi:hypothetical protein